jgi:hypothetical protein
MENEMIAAIVALFGAMMMAGREPLFTPSEKGGSPVHWFRLNVGEVCSFRIDKILFGVTGSFASELGLAVPENRDGKKPESGTDMAALIVTSEPVIQPDGHEWMECLMLQQAAVNDLMALVMQSCNIDEDSVEWGDSYTPNSGKGLHVTVNHDKTSHGNRTRYTVTEVA